MQKINVYGSHSTGSCGLINHSPNKIVVAFALAKSRAVHSVVECSGFYFAHIWNYAPPRYRPHPDVAFAVAVQVVNANGLKTHRGNIGLFRHSYEA
jgi:hypothetical protein